MKMSYHDHSDQNNHGIVKCAGDVQEVPTHKSLQVLDKKIIKQQIK